MLNGVTLPIKRRIFTRRRSGMTTRLPFVVLGACLSIALVIGLMLAGNDYRTGLGHAGEHTGDVKVGS